jgi:hypothetical protein
LEFYFGFINLSLGLKSRYSHTTGISSMRKTNNIIINTFRSYSTLSCSEDFYK